MRLYELTPWGYAAEEAIKVLGRWAATSPRHDPTLPLSAASLMLGFRTMFMTERAEGLEMTATMRVGTDSFRVAVTGGQLDIARGEAELPGFVTTAPAVMPVAALVYGKVPLEQVEAMGLAVMGNRDLLLRFSDCFELPVKLG